MANVQTLLQPISALGNQPAAMRSAGRTASDAQGNRVDAADSLNDDALNPEHSFSKLLNDSSGSKPLETSRGRQLASEETDLNPTSLSALGTAELNPLGGNELPFDGQTLPPSTAVVVESLAEGFYQISEDLQSSSVFSKGIAGDVFSGGIELENGALKYTESPVQQQGESVLSVSPSDESEIAGYNAVLVGDTSGAVSSLLVDIGESESTVAASLTNSLADTAIAPQSAPQKSDAEIGFTAADTLLEEGRKVFSQFNGEQIGDTSAKASLLGSADTAASTSLNGSMNSDGIKQGRSKGVEFQNAIDISISDQDSEAEFSKFEGIISNQNSRGGEKVLQPVSGNLLADTGAGAAQNAGVSNGSSLTNALSQWRENQNSSAVNTDPLERQGFTKLAVPFNQAGWGENLGRQLSLLVAKNMDSAQIQLDPPELGPLVVKIQINQDQVSLQFTSGHSIVREALEQSSQRLQQMLSDEGLDLIDVGVSDQKPGQNNDSNDRDDKSKDQSTPSQSAVDPTEESDGLLTHARNLTIDDGNIDYFI